MDRTGKEALVASIKQLFTDSVLVVVTHYSGLTVAEMTDLRGRMREADASFRVTKNRLTRLALEGTAFEGLSSLFTGPTAVACSVDPVAAAKVAVNFSKENEKLLILGGAFGEQLLDVDSVKTLASLPSLGGVRGQLVGLVQTPATRIAGVLQAPGGQLARVFGAYGAGEEAA